MADRKLVEEVVTAEEADARLDKWLKRRFPFTQGEVQKHLRNRDILVNSVRAEANQRVNAGDNVGIKSHLLADIFSRKKALSQRNKTDQIDPKIVQTLKDMIVYEDADMIVFNKPPGLAVQGGTGLTTHLDGWLKHLIDKKTGHIPRLVHRLDKATSGLLVTAKTPVSAAQLGAMFKDRTLNKIYWAIVMGVPSPREGQVRSWVAKRRDPEGREQMEVVAHGAKHAKHAVTDYVTLDQAGQRLAWLAMRPRSGRTHQLRLHMQELGTAILGDEKYKTRREVPSGLSGQLHLHARALIIPWKHKPPLEITANLPPHFRATMRALGFEASQSPHDPF